MDGKFLPIQNRLIYTPSKVQSLSLPKYFFIIYKHPLKALHVFGYLAEIKQLLFNDTSDIVLQGTT